MTPVSHPDRVVRFRLDATTRRNLTDARCEAQSHDDAGAGDARPREESLMKTRKTARACLWAAPLAAVSLLLAACGSASTPAGTTVTNPKAASPAGSWPYPNGDLANTRDAAGSTISSANVAGLQQAWTFRLPAGLVTIRTRLWLADRDADRRPTASSTCRISVTTCMRCRSPPGS